MNSKDNEVKYCWCNADPTQVRMKSTDPSPDPKTALLRVYDWPDSRERHENRRPSFPYKVLGDITHKDCKNTLIRGRGMYWWFSEQLKLEDKIAAGTLHPVVGSFYCFLEEDHTPGYNVLGVPLRGVDTSKPPVVLTFRYGNVFCYTPKEGYYWGVKCVAFPKGHPDGNLPPFKMIDVIDPIHKH